MNDETQVISKRPEASSQIANVSVRAWLALIVVATVCIMSACGTKIEEPLYTLVGAIAGMYFGQNSKQPAK